MSNIRILKTYREVQPFLKQVQALADSCRHALGFFPKAVYHDIAAEGRLWIAIVEANQVAGFLTFGGRFLQIGVRQLFVTPEFRQKGVGALLVTGLVDYAEERGYLSIKARVASDLLGSNVFWERMGFDLVRREVGGKSRNREILVRVKPTKSPSLLDVMEDSSLQPREFPHALIADPARLGTIRHFSLDLNVLLDVAKGRIHAADSGHLFGSAMGGLIKLSVSHELLTELKRARPGAPNDPVLAFAATLPVLPEADQESAELLERLRTIVFPARTGRDKLSPQELSDLLHIASAIRRRLDGFVTRDQALLDASDQLNEEFRILVVSPAELIEPRFEDRASTGAITVVSSASQLLSIQPVRNETEAAASRFLSDVGCSDTQIRNIIDSGTSAKARHIQAAFVGGDPIAVCSWDRPTAFSASMVGHLIVDEATPVAQRAIDHFLEEMLRVAASADVWRIQIECGSDQPLTIATAQSRGFSNVKKEGTRLHVEKPMAGRLISEENWKEARGRLLEHTGIRLPFEAPSFAAFEQRGIEVADFKGRRVRLCRFDLETILSPVLFLFSESPGLVLPIRQAFARDLLGEFDVQLGLLPSSEAFLRIEKAYFRSPWGVADLEKGTPVIFYVSGRGGGVKAAIGVARVTRSEVMPVEEAELTFERHGVLDPTELKQVAKNGQLHVITFDNFKKFDVYVPYEKLAALIRLKANLQVPQRIGGRTLARICEEGFK